MQILFSRKYHLDVNTSHTYHGQNL